CIINYMGVSDVAQDADGVTVTVQNYAPITKNGESAKDGEDAKASESVLDEPGETYQIRAKCVVNATGAWANQFDKADGKDAPNIRPARGSHIVIDSKKLPIDASFTVLHPRDNRPIFVYPWLGRTVIGTTDLDHPALGNAEVGMTQEELDYLLELTAWQFPDLQLKAQDVLASWAGVRPLVASGGLNSSGEKRDHSVWQNKRFISVSGGKLTTFRYIAKDVLEHAEDWLGEELSKSKRAQYFAKEEIEKDSTNTSSLSAASSHSSQRLKGHYGPELSSMLRNANQDTLGCVADTDILWQELVWSAGHEAVVHLDDLMLRRCRLGLLLTEGGLQFEDQLKTLLQPIFGWNDSQWQSEVERYRDIWHRYYWLPSHA
ncbi:MAG: FAD-dependent oxidoreductase, partial [Oleibacter sp.]|nr:FAD-dependent oxidoreductase [Thalassolituus sp.]